MGKDILKSKWGNLGFKNHLEVMNKEKFQINNVVKIIKYPDQPHWFNEKTGYKLGFLYIVTKQKSAYYGNIYMYELSSVGGSPIGGMPEDCMEFCYDVCAENNNKELIYEVW